MRQAENLSPMGARIRQARDARGLSQSAVATACGHDSQQQSKYENGWVEPKAEKLLQIANTLGVRIEWLISGEGPMQRDDEPAATGTGGE